MRYSRKPLHFYAGVRIVIGLATAAAALSCADGAAPPASNGAGGRGGSGTGGTGAGGSGATASGGSQNQTGGSGGSSFAGGSGGTWSGVGGAAGSSNMSSGGMSGSAGAGGAANPYSADAAFCANELDSASQTFTDFLKAYTDPTKIPRSVDNGTVNFVGIGDWTSGFVAGSLWLLYEHNHETAFRDAAQTWTNVLYPERLRTDTHDVGFMIMSSYGNGYRLTQNQAYVPVIETAAKSLATRFNPTVGCTRSWDGGPWSFPVIIDNMMNLELLYRGSELSGDSKFKDMAVSHALTTLANHFRPDHSSYHLVDYNPDTGAVIKKQTVQGLSDNSAWARGQTWGLYGFTMSYRESKDPRFLQQALAIADYYTQNAGMPSDDIPYFDFSAPSRNDVPNYRDASAGAVAASALLELAKYAPAAAAARYRAFAIKALRSLSSSQYRAKRGENGDFLLMHSVGNYPANSEIDVAINYADYYYLEALLRCAALAN